MESPTKGVGEPGIEFNGDNAACGCRQYFRQSSGAGSDLDDEIVARDRGLRHEFASERVASKEVLAARPRFA